VGRVEKSPVLEFSSIEGRKPYWALLDGGETKINLLRVKKMAVV